MWKFNTRTRCRHPRFSLKTKWRIESELQRYRTGHGIHNKSYPSVGATEK